MHKRVKVCIRVRSASKDHAGIQVNEQEKTISVLNQLNGNGTCFHFDDVLGSQVTQEQVYQRVAAEASESVLHGYNGTVMAYGQTGAGKTFTMSGGKTSFSDRGICARSIASVFQAIQNDSEHTYSVRVSYVEIYNEQLYDLLDFSEHDTNHKDLVVQDNDKGGAVFSSPHGPLTTGGSERMKKTLVTGAMLKETMHINKSLTFLEQVVIALGDHKREHIPYRQTTLTNILKDSLGGNCRTLLIACVWPDESQNDQTLATLKFATRMMRVKTSAVVNVSQEQHVQAKKLTDEIKRLKGELALHDTLAGRSRVVYDAMSPEQMAEMKAAIERFVAGDGSQGLLPVVNVVQVQTLFQLFRQVALEHKAAAGPEVDGMPPAQPTIVESPVTSLDHKEDESNDNALLHQQPSDIQPSTRTDDEPERTNDDAALLDEFKQHLAVQLEQAKQNFRKAKKQAVQCATDVNLAKRYPNLRDDHP
ncbi:hypothetical protein DYB31_000971 [Aphanomyces astaci]|uniref:Kinesin motor domain-containing protein n=1 Tax=Aphanomyces astaci TaxID=112090 RepID=A0A397F8I6_APHAT|nr:hypothetical protein DYB31_000971 [Aphanomyces astaci]